jgi:hypothetical protein
MSNSTIALTIGGELVATTFNFHIIPRKSTAAGVSA